MFKDGVVEGVQEPRGVGDLLVGEDAEDVQVGVGREAEALLRTTNHSRHERPVT